MKLGPWEFRIVEGGDKRHLSVANGLDAVSDGCEFVAVHDAARPLIHAESISACLQGARDRGAAACANRVTETMKRADDSRLVAASVDRENLWAMETPQCFRLEILRRAYDRVLQDGLTVTDEVFRGRGAGRAGFARGKSASEPENHLPRGFGLGRAAHLAETRARLPAFWM